MENEVFSANNLLLRGISEIGRARIKHRDSPLEAFIILKKGVSKINQSIAQDPYSIENRLERLKHFVGITTNSPLNLSKIILKDFDFFKNITDELTVKQISFIYFLEGQYFLYKKESVKALEKLKKCIELYPDSLEAIEAKISIETLLSNI